MENIVWALETHVGDISINNIYSFKTTTANISLMDYLKRIYKYIVNAKYYDEMIIKTIENCTYNLNTNTWHKFIAAIFLYLDKLYNDDCYDNKWYAQVFGLALDELNKIEIQFLRDINLIRKIE